jgi:hypothetical protein
MDRVDLNTGLPVSYSGLDSWGVATSLNGNFSAVGAGGSIYVYKNFADGSHSFIKDVPIPADVQAFLGPDMTAWAWTWVAVPLIQIIIL